MREEILMLQQKPVNNVGKNALHGATELLPFTTQGMYHLPLFGVWITSPNNRPRSSPVAFLWATLYDEPHAKDGMDHRTVPAVRENPTL